MNDLVSEYQQYQDATAEEEGEFDEEIGWALGNVVSESESGIRELFCGHIKSAVLWLLDSIRFIPKNVFLETERKS